MAPAPRLRLGFLLATLCCAVGGNAADAAVPSPVEATRPTPDLRVAVDRSLALIQASAAEYRNQRQCFSCHHQALPVLALAEARDRGFAIDESNLAAQLDHTAAHLERGREGYAEARGQGGGVDTAGWALWALEAGGRTPNDTTAAVASYLAVHRADESRWPSTGSRPPTQGSEFTATYVALRGLQTFGTPGRSEEIAARKDRVLDWLLSTEPGDTEDRVFRLRSLFFLAAEDETVRAAAQELIESQRPDGGWPQTSDLPSDAYATGTVLAALQETGRLDVDDPAYRRGVEYLLRTQRADGSWHVATRSKPIQIYFESGFPHGKDQFVSMSATCWAVLALLPACPAP